MELRVVDRRSKAIAAFNDREWPNADREHYGVVGKWTEKESRIVAREKAKIVGSLHLSVKRGVCEVHALIVAKDARGTGVGTALMQRAEKIARKEHAHKMWLVTGKGWDAEPFYRKLGFRKTVVLKQHFFKKDFVLYEKTLR